MEPASLTTAVIALADSLNNAVECLEHIQLDRNFSKSLSQRAEAG